MTEHVCSRCGYDEPCSYGAWHDRHPVVAVIGGMFAIVFMGMLFSVYTLGATIMTVIVASAIGIRAIARERRTRAALVRRADYEHAVLMARSAMPAIRLHPRNPVPPTRPHPHVVMQPPRTQPLNHKA